MNPPPICCTGRPLKLERGQVLEYRCGHRYRVVWSLTGDTATPGQVTPRRTSGDAVTPNPEKKLILKKQRTAARAA